MNIPALLIATGFGAVFLAAELRWYVQPPAIDAKPVMSALSSDHMKARAAVRNVLVAPDTAQFEGLRSVTEGATKYVCGLVKARDRSGNVADAPFVYAVAANFVRVDDGGRLTREQASYRPCPVIEDEPKVAQKDPDKKLAISPAALAVVKTAVQLMPEGDPATLTALSATMTEAAGSRAGGAGGQRMEQQIAALAGKTVGSAGGSSAGQTIVSERGKPTASASKPSEWRADQPPPNWPKFPQGHPLAVPTERRPPSEALALARDVEERWKKSEAAGDPRLRPSAKDIKDASRALLTIDCIDIEYRQAWAAFVRLQEMDRIVTTG
ncbi:conserved exported hypothetical protein [Bradyrhizobium sp. ORS 375]|uniref:hypothetical protein n=1 Tax=Bradyrhizobium sp. (strain ORS 375) TaxID=566679 RepID=UPI0002406A27|nr:hypothetical protein [Bradyrhizobium sp. ORS 375]CCD95607.1 conserved exported hypothetical protein [Bradyrhizobium sp. ORS 375]